MLIKARGPISTQCLGNYCGYFMEGRDLGPISVTTECVDGGGVGVIVTSDVTKGTNLMEFGGIKTCLECRIALYGEHEGNTNPVKCR